MSLKRRLQLQALGMMDCANDINRKLKGRDARTQYAIGYGIQYNIEQCLAERCG